MTRLLARTVCLTLFLTVAPIVKGQEPPEGTIPLHKIYSANFGDNWTLADASTGPDGPFPGGYRYARLEGYVFENQEPDTVPLHQWESPSRDDHHSTTHPVWLGSRTDTHRAPDYIWRGILGYVFDPEKPQPQGTVPLVRWYDPDRGDNHTTTHPVWQGGEGETRDPNYRFSRIVGYIYPPLGQSPTSPAPSSSIGSSLRIGTYNAKFLTTPADIRDACPLRNLATCIGLLAEKILQSDYDVIVFQEGFDDEFQDKITNLLRTEFPHYVKYIDGDNDHTDLSPDEIDTLPLITAGHFVGGRLLPGGTIEETLLFRILTGYPCGEGFFPGTDLCNDSGLMIFSRFPFVDLPDPKSTIIDPDEVIASNGAGTSEEWKDVAFSEFIFCSNENDGDCWSNKGVALVRIQHPDGTIYNIAFTHMESGNAPIEKEIRALQLRQIQAHIEATLGSPIDEITEPILVVGDFNIDGDLEKPERQESSIENEWERHFSEDGSGESGTFFDHLRDTWEFEKHDFTHVSVRDRDRGLTSSTSNPGTRIDFILRNFSTTANSNTPFCVQHTTLAFNLYSRGPGYETGFGVGGTLPLSDHRGINADINRNASRCSSHLADPIGLPDFENEYSTVTLPNTLLEFPGSVQWYLLKTPGTYSIHLDGPAGLHYQVFASDDLTRALDPHLGLQTNFTDDSGNQIHGFTFVSPDDKPLYVKVVHENRNWSGPYNLMIHRHGCRTPQDICPLLPNVVSRQPFQFRPMGAIGGSDELFFRIDTDGPLVDRPQQLLLYASEDSVDPANNPSNLLQLDLLENDGATPLASGTVPNSSGTHAIIEREALEDNRRTMVLRVRKSDPSAANDVIVGWKTNLRMFKLISILAKKETDDLGGGDEDDRVQLQLYVNRVPAFENSWRPVLGNFEESDQRDIPLVCPIGFVPDRPDLEQRVVWLEEEDPGDNDFLKGSGNEMLIGKEKTLIIHEFQESDHPPAVGTIPISPAGNGYIPGGNGKYSLLFSQLAGTHTLHYTSAVQAQGSITCQERSPLYDSDEDGIVDTVDLRQSRFSDEFNDFLIGGITEGRIIDRGERNWRIEDIPVDPSTPQREGVRITVNPGDKEGVVELGGPVSGPCSTSEIRIPPSSTEQQIVATC